MTRPGALGPTGPAPDCICIHAGHGKTGSSYIQSSLALSQERLAEQGLFYPIGAEDRARAGAGHINEGNLVPGPGRTLHPKGSFRRFACRAAPLPGPGKTLLVSNENIFRSIAEAGFLDEARAVYPRARLRVLLFIRDPFEHAVSAYQQNVKRQGRADSFSDFLPGYRMPAAVLAALHATNAAGAELVVRNYSRHKRALVECVEDWLGLARGALLRPRARRVNRSLTRAELELQRAFNRSFGKASSRFISDVLCNELPDITPEPPHATHEALAEFLERMRALTAPVNALLPRAEHYHIESLAALCAQMPSEAQARSLHLTPAQIRVLAHSLSARIKAARPG
ncbi:hypothetical protein [Alkalilacustris brevis]|uniref:hypothetical protein n=1 Tax=Alkalilacustris brevis TaxID=2026338 RepID=UPI000E0D807E|nr:hypothetical protein [Alkalilacustris brevis]